MGFIKLLVGSTSVRYVVGRSKRASARDSLCGSVADDVLRPAGGVACMVRGTAARACGFSFLFVPLQWDWVGLLGRKTGVQMDGLHCGLMGASFIARCRGGDRA